MTPVIAAPWLLVLHDTGEGGGVKTRPTDQGAVDVGLRHERVDGLRLDAAAVEDAHPLRGGGRSEAHQLAANGVVDFLGLPRGRGASGADRPHRLVGDDAAGQLLGACAGERALHLPCDHRPGGLRLALRQRLADAHDRDEARREAGVQAAVHGLVGLAEVLPALGVPDDDVGAAALAQHGDRDLARVGALRLPVDVLTGEADVRPRERRPHCFEGREGRRDHDLAPAHMADALGERARQRDRLGARTVHLPVAGDERRAGHRGASAQRAGAVSSSAASPGSSRPSRNSSDAPPPVETWVTASARPARASAATESPPPTTVVPFERASARAIAMVPSPKASISKIPMGPFQRAVRAAAISRANASTVRGPMSTPRSSAGKSSAPTTRVVAPAAARSAARWSTGRRTRTPRAAARASVWAARSILSASTRERPTGFPCARRNVYAMAPPMQKDWTRPSRFSSTPILSDTLAPPRTVTKGCSGAARRRCRNSTSRRSRNPSALSRKKRAMPAVEAWARWAAPKASSTYTSARCASRSAKLGSSFSSPGWKRRFSSTTT